ncbi:glycosyltransferase [Candidatus Parcubacteria bacterium]|nr:MAG: glycosyltransferase [Candidatus Parcubacteria bacterium]
MKIVFITSAAYLDTCLPLVNDLAQKNEICLLINFSFNTKNISFLNIKENFKENQIIHEGNYLLGDMIKLLDNSLRIKITFIYWKSWKIFSIKNWLFVKNIYNLINGEIIHTQLLSIYYLFLLRIKKRKVKKIVIDFHDPFEHQGSSESILLNYTKSSFIKIASNIIIHNHSQLNPFMKKYNIMNNVDVVPLGIIPLNKIYRVQNVKTNTNNILFFGRIEPYKGIEYFVEAVKKIKKNNLNFKAIIAGNGKFYFDISNLYNDPYFKIINRYITNEEMVRLIQESKFVVCPYIESTQSGVVMTVFAFFKPVIASNIGGFTEIIQDGITGRLVSVRDVDALVSAISEYLTDENKIQVISSNIKNLVISGKFSWHNIAEKTLKIYNK